MNSSDNRCKLEVPVLSSRQRHNVLRRLSIFCFGKNLVRSSGFEPPRYCYRQPLKLVRLPVPPRPHRGKNFIVNAAPSSGKAPLQVEDRALLPLWRGNRRTAKTEAYGFAGVDGAGGCGVDDCGCGVDDCDCGAAGSAGVAGTGLAGVGFVAAGAGFENFCKIDPPCSTLRSTRTTIAIAHTMNITAHHVVACESTEAAPRGPNAVWLPAPPKAPARSAALPLCSNTTTIKTKQFSTKKVFSSHAAHRNPTAIIPNPTINAIVHLIQPGISCTSLPISLTKTREPFGVAATRIIKPCNEPLYRGQSFTTLANDFASRLAPPTSTPSNSFCAIRP